jgi:hypothetical protein
MGSHSHGNRSGGACFGTADAAEPRLSSSYTGDEWFIGCFIALFSTIVIFMLT